MLRDIDNITTETELDICFYLSFDIESPFLAKCSDIEEESKISKGQ